MEDVNNTSISQTINGKARYLNFSDGSVIATSTPENLMVTVAMSAPAVYCGESWATFWNFLAPVNLPARAIVCIIGIITNILSILVFTRKSMRNPTNVVLIALCVSDLLCLLRLAEYEMVKYIRPGHMLHGDPGWKLTYSMAIHNFANEILVNLFHSWSVNLTIVLSFWRLVGVTQPLRSRRLNTDAGAKGLIFSAILVGLILMIPMYCYAYILQTTVNSIGVPLPEAQYQWTMSVNWDWHLYLWTHIIFIKVLPCSILTVVTVILVIFLLKAQKNRNNLMKSNPTRALADKNIGEEKSKESTQAQKSRSEYDRITRMLIIVVVVFVVTEFPFGIINLLNSILGYEFLIQCKNPALPFLNLGEFLSPAANFFIYFFMSNNFRLNFYELFKTSTNGNINTNSKSTSTTADK